MVASLCDQCETFDLHRFNLHELKKNQNWANDDERTMPKECMFILQMISDFANEGYLK